MQPIYRQISLAVSLLPVLSLPAWAAPISRSAEAMRTANALIGRHQIRQALPYLDRAIALDAKSAEAYCQRGNAHFQLEELELAERDLNKAISLNPRLAEAYFQKARVYGERGNFDMALSESAKATELAGSTAEALWFQDRGSWYVEKGDNVHASAEYSRAIQRSPKEMWLYYFRAAAYYKTGSYLKAISDLNIAGQPKSEVSLGRVRELRAQCYDKLGKHDLAAKDRKAARSEALEKMDEL